MKDRLLQLGFSDKEAEVYLALLEFGTQPASVIARKTNFPRVTVLFLLDNLVKKGYVRKSRRGRAQYFYAETKDLQEKKAQELKNQQEALAETVELLKEYKNPFTSPPKLTFFEGIDGCRKAYSMLLTSKTEILEFAAHEDLEKMGKDFMSGFIAERARKKIFIHDIGVRSPLNIAFQKLDKKQHRELRMFDSKKGNLYSSIDVFEDKVLILNLHQDAFAILIENHAVVETLKTIHRLAWESTK